MFLAINLSYLSYMDYIFYLILILAIVVGFLRGLKKTLFNFVMMTIFYVVFFVTISSVVNFLWTFNMPWLGGMLGQIDISLNGFTNFEDSLNSFIQLGLGNTIDLSNSSTEVIALATGIMQFVLKIIWTIVYFTVILVIYKVICFIISAIFLHSKQGSSKNRGFGALFGVLNGILAIFVMMIMVGGVISTLESAIEIMDSSNGAQSLSFDGRFLGYDGNATIIPLASSTDINTSMDDLQSMVDSYNANIFVKIADKITTKSTINPDITVPLNLDLFDKVLSFDYNGQTVGFRYELSVFSSAAKVIVDSNYYTTKQITDLTGDEIRSVFAKLSESNLIVSIMPVAIEVAADMYDKNLSMTTTELYAIDYEKELTNIGSIAGALFDILNGAGFIGGEGSVNQITIDGDAVRDIFSNIADSDTLLMITDSLLFPMLEDSKSGIQTIITVPDNLDIKAEYLALGEIFAEIIDSNIAFSDLADADVSVLLSAVSEINLEDLLNSQLVTQALINILSGTTDIQGLDILTIPDNITWRDTTDNLGDITQNGELRNILIALNSFFNTAGDIDFNNLDISALVDMDNQTIEDFFGSYVVRATVSNIISATELGDIPLVIPDSVYDSQGYFTESELISVVKAIKLVLVDSGTTTTFDIMKILNLKGNEIDTLLGSDIIYATVGKEIYDFGSSSLTIPSTVETTVQVNSASQTVINKVEIKNILFALGVLQISDLDNMSFDASIIGSLENQTNDALDDTKLLTLLRSEIVHATVSSMILDLDVSNGGVLNIPDLDINGTVLKYSANSLEYISKTEITNILKALYNIGITDFNNINLEDTSLLLNNLSDLLISGIIHATISEQILNLAPIVSIPEDNAVGTPILINQGTTTYISTDELTHMLDALNLMGITDPTTFSSNFSLNVIDTTTKQDILLSSAIMHATISKTLFDLGDAILKIPTYEEDGVTKVRITTGSVGNETEFVSSSEIKNMVDAFVTMGFNNLNEFNAEINTQLFLDNATAILASSSLQATLSNQILTNTSGNIIIPDKDSLANDIRIIQSDVTYISTSELANFINSINLLGMGDFDTFDMNPSDLFVINLNTFFDSYIMKATVSKYILDQSGDENAAYGSTSLLVPSTERESILVNLNPGVQIKTTELINLINALNVLGMGNFNDNVNAGNMTNLSDADMATALQSNSIHLTMDNMLRSNPNISTIIPALAEVASYNIIVTSKQEIADFIKAANILGTGNFDEIDFDVTAISGLSVADRDVVLNSMIVRNKLTDELEAMMLADDPLDLYWPANTSYEQNNSSLFLTKNGINEVLTHYGLI